MTQPMLKKELSKKLTDITMERDIVRSQLNKCVDFAKQAKSNLIADKRDDADNCLDQIINTSYRNEL